jgi:hypothetical protein
MAGASLAFRRLLSVAGRLTNRYFYANAPTAAIALIEQSKIVEEGGPQRDAACRIGTGSLFRFWNNDRLPRDKRTHLHAQETADRAPTLPRRRQMTMPVSMAAFEF